jgi:hypothetical protein
VQRGPVGDPDIRRSPESRRVSVCPRGYLRGVHQLVAGGRCAKRAVYPDPRTLISIASVIAAAAMADALMGSMVAGRIR